MPYECGELDVELAYTETDPQSLVSRKYILRICASILAIANDSHVSLRTLPAQSTSFHGSKTRGLSYLYAPSESGLNAATTSLSTTKADTGLVCFTFCLLATWSSKGCTLPT